MDPKYLQEKPQAEEETYETEFKARLPKNLEHIVSLKLVFQKFKARLQKNQGAAWPSG